MCSSFLQLSLPSAHTAATSSEIRVSDGQTTYFWSFPGGTSPEARGGESTEYTMSDDDWNGSRSPSPARHEGAESQPDNSAPKPAAAEEAAPTQPLNPIRPTERSKLPLHLRQRVFIFKREHKREVLIHRLVHLTARNESNSDHGNLPSERWHRTLILRCRAGQ